MAKQSLKSMVKRKWTATYDRATGNWYTGYDGHIQTTPHMERVRDANGEFIWEEYTDGNGNSRSKVKISLQENSKHIQNDVHEVRELTVRYSTYIRGRSAANFILKDKSGYVYETSCSGFDEFLNAIFAGEVYGEEGSFVDEIGDKQKTTWFTAKFVQAKQGANIFIEYFGDKK